MFTDPWGIFAFFSLLPGYWTPAYESKGNFLSNFLAPPAAAPPKSMVDEFPELMRRNASAVESGGKGQPMLIITEASDYVVPLMKEGLAGLLEDGEWTASWLVFCADEKCFEWCNASVKPAEKVCRRTNVTLKGSTYGQGDYLKHVWLKWVLIRSALMGHFGPVGSVLFLDADVAVLSGGRQGLEQCLMRPLSDGSSLPHFQYQHGPWGGVNGGVLWFRPSDLTLEFIDAVYSKRHEHKRDDQAWAGWWSKQPEFVRKGWLHRQLPKTLFHSYCFEREYKEKVTWLARTHHPTCRVGTAEKLMDVRRARKMWHKSLMNATLTGSAQQDACQLM